MDQPQTSGNRNLTNKELLVAFGSIAWFLAGIVVTLVYSKLIGGLMLAPFAIAMLVGLVGLWRLTPQQSQRIAEAMHKQEQTLFGQLMRIVKVAVFLMILVAALRWAYGQLF
jgi:uncharacterized membrane protein YuzA (DUF378 family)